MPPVIAAGVAIAGAISGAVAGVAGAVGAAIGIGGPMILTGGALYGGFGVPVLGALAAGASLSAAIGAAGILGTVGSIALGVGASVGANLLLRSLARSPTLDDSSVFASAAAPESIQNTLRQAVGARIGHYGRVKVGGQLALYDSAGGKFYIVICTAARAISAVVEHWLGEAVVSIDADGYVTDAQYQYGSVTVPTDSGTKTSSSRVRLVPQLGTTTQVAHAQLVADLPSLWASSARGRGIANIMIVFQDVPAEQYRAMYPQGAPQYRSVLDGAPIYDMREAAHSSADETTWELSRNPALCILDYLTHSDGMGRPRALFSEASFAAAADICDEPVALAAGGTEPRYQLSGSYDFTERPIDVLTRMLATCDGELYPLTDGTWGLRVGKWYEPTESLSDADGEIISYQMEEYPDALRGFNIVKSVYVSPLHDYQETQAEEWIDSTLLEVYGEQRTNDLRLPMVQSPSQARRLAKIATAKGNPQWSGVLVATLAGLKAYSEPTLLITLTELDIVSMPFKVSGLRFKPESGTVEIDVFSLPSETYAWDAATEEGTAPPIPPDSPAVQVPPTPTGFSAVAGQITIQSGTSAASIAASWSAPQRDSVSHEVQHKKSTFSDWTSEKVPAEITTLEFGPLDDGSSYDVRLRAVSPGGVPSEWTATTTVVATADPSAPAAPSGLTSSKSGAQITINWTNPASLNFYKTVVYRNSINNNPATATAVATYYGGISTARSHTSGALSNGTHYYWVEAFNASDVGSGKTGPTSQTLP